MRTRLSLGLFLFWISIVNWANAALQTVYIDRPSSSGTWEPYFDPSSINASVGDQVQFIARFGALPDVTLHSKQMLMIRQTSCLLTLALANLTSLRDALITKVHPSTNRLIRRLFLGFLPDRCLWKCQRIGVYALSIWSGSPFLFYGHVKRAI